jgi:hypothetical protein
MRHFAGAAFGSPAANAAPGVVSPSALLAQEFEPIEHSF